MTFTVTVFWKMMHLEILLIVCILLILLRQLCCSKKWVIRLCLFRDISRMPNLFKERCEVCLPYQIPSGCFFLFTAVYSQNITENEVYLTPKRKQLNQPLYTSVYASWHNAVCEVLLPALLSVPAQTWFHKTRHSSGRLCTFPLPSSSNTTQTQPSISVLVFLTQRTAKLTIGLNGIEVFTNAVIIFWERVLKITFPVTPRQHLGLWQIFQMGRWKYFSTQPPIFVFILIWHGGRI